MLYTIVYNIDYYIQLDVKRENVHKYKYLYLFNYLFIYKQYALQIPMQTNSQIKIFLPCVDVVGTLAKW